MIIPSVFFPELISVSIAKPEMFTKEDSTAVIPVAFYQSNKPFTKQNEETLRQWLKAKLKVDTIEIFKR